MNYPNWSKAPAGATHYDLDDYSSSAWLKYDGNTWCYWGSDDCWEGIEAGVEDEFFVDDYLLPRPAQWHPQQIKFVKLSTTAITPTRGTEGSAGLDLYADQDVLVSSGASVMVSTAIAVEIPANHVGLVAIRSSVSRSGVSLTNSVGVIDSDYRGEIKLCLVYTAGNGGHYVRKGQAIAQLIVMPVLPVELMQVDSLSSTDRGTGGFGSTGR